MVTQWPQLASQFGSSPPMFEMPEAQGGRGVCVAVEGTGVEVLKAKVPSGVWAACAKALPVCIRSNAGRKARMTPSSKTCLMLMPPA